MPVEAVRDAYLARWGDPSRTAHFQVDRWEIEVYKWSADRTSEGVDLYATLGGSRWSAPGQAPEHRIELFTGLRPGRDAIASPLAALGLYPHREGEPIDHGHTVPAGQPLWPGTEMRTFLVVRQGAAIVPALSLPTGEHVEFLQAIPLYDSEREFKVAHGAEALLARWEAARTPFWDPDRRPAC